MPTKNSVPLLSLPGRKVMLDRNLYGTPLHVTHEAGGSTLHLAWPAEAHSTPQVAIDPLSRCPEMDARLPRELTLRPPTDTTAWLRTPGDHLLGLCLATGDIWVLVPLEDSCEPWNDVGLDEWGSNGPALRNSMDRWGFTFRGAGTPALQDWWWQLAPDWLHRPEPGRYTIPRVITEATAADVLWRAVAGSDVKGARPLLPLTDVEFTANVAIQAQWAYMGMRFTWWTDDVVSVADSFYDEEDCRPPSYSPFVLPKLVPAIQSNRVRHLVEEAPKP